jgi:hypothetical protein
MDVELEAEVEHHERAEWVTWRFSDEEETRRRAYLPLA